MSAPTVFVNLLGTQTPPRQIEPPFVFDIRNISNEHNI